MLRLLKNPFKRHIIHQISPAIAPITANKDRASQEPIKVPTSDWDEDAKIIVISWVLSPSSMRTIEDKPIKKAFLDLTFGRSPSETIAISQTADFRFLVKVINW